MADEQTLFSDPLSPDPSSVGLRPLETPLLAGPPRTLSMFSQPDEPVRAAAAQALSSQTTPDDAARVLRLQSKTGLPADVIRRNVEQVERDALSRDLDPERIRRESPYVASWLTSDPYHAAVAQDDVHALTYLESAIHTARLVTGAVGAGVMDFSQGIWGAVQAGADALGASNVARFAAGSAGVAGSMATLARGDRSREGWVGQNLYGGIEGTGQMLPSLVLGVLLGPEALIGSMGVSTGGTGYTEARGESAGFGKALTFGSLQGGIAAATSLIPAHRLLADVAGHTPFIQTLLRQAVTALPGQEIATALTDLNEWSLLPRNREKTIGDYLDERPSQAAAAAVSTIAMVGATTAVSHGSARVLDAIGAAARQSKTAQRAPDRVEGLVREMTADGQASAVYLPIDAFNTYWQGRGVDPAVKAFDLTGDPTAFETATQTGGDLSVPMAKYVTAIAAHEHQAYFRDEAKLTPDLPNARQAREIDGALGGRTEALSEDVLRALEGAAAGRPDGEAGIIDAVLAMGQHDERTRPVLTSALADAAGLTADERAAYQATVNAASDRARARLREDLQAQRDREQTPEWQDARQALVREVTQELNQDPTHRALALLERGTQPDGSPLAESLPGVHPLRDFKLSREALVEQFGEGVLKRLPEGVVGREGLPADIAAELLGMPSATALVQRLINTVPFDQAVAAEVDARMRASHGDILTDGSLLDRARSAVLDAHQEVFAAELKALAAAISRSPGEPHVSTPSPESFRALAQTRVGGMRIEELRPDRFAAAARQAGERALTAASRQDFRAALIAKQQQVFSAELHRAATDARGHVDASLAGFKRLFGADTAMGKRYNLDLMNAARAILGEFGIAPRFQTQAAHRYLEQVRQYDPEMYGDLAAAVEAAAQPGRPYTELTFDEFSALRDGINNLVHTARRSRQMVIDGKAHELDDVRDTLSNRLQAVTTPQERRGYQRKVGEWEKSKLTLMGWRAWGRRVESWVDAVDGRTDGPFRRFLWNPIREATTAYRLSKRSTIESYLEIVRDVEPSLTSKDIDAPEIGYTFSGKVELLHALLHTGNPSNFSKLLRGRGWGFEQADGALDTARWDAFMHRAWRDGILTAADYRYVQGVWDLLERMKPDAQRVHHDLYGYYFNEVTASPVVTPFGTFRGGYFPAIVDPMIAEDAAMRADRAAVEATPNSFMFPSTGRGFTKARIEPYAQPLQLDLRLVPSHIDKVLRFTYVEPRIKDAARLITNKGFRRTLSAFDPTVASEMLVPWLQRAATQMIDIPAQGFGGRGADRFWRTVRRRTGLQLMAGNVLNALQQVTGLSLSSVEVPAPALGRAMWQYVRGPGALAEDVAAKSAFMRTRTTTQTLEIQQTIDDLLLNPSRYDQARAFAAKHGHVLSQMTQNIVDLVTWSGAYDDAVARGTDEVGAVRHADATVRKTQGSFDPEDVSAFESSTPFVRAFSMFSSYFNMQANLLGTEYTKAVRDMGLRAGAGRLLYVYAFGFMVPALISEAITKVGSGDAWDEDEDGSLVPDTLAWFFGAQRRGLAAMLPVVGPAINSAANVWNNKPYDDRITASPAITAIESTVRAPKEIYDTITNGGPRKRAVRDALTALGLLTGLPLAPLGRPLGYLSDVDEGRVVPDNPLDAARGAVVGR